MDNLRQGMISIFLAQALKNNQILVKGSKDRFRDFVYIDDVVDAFLACQTIKGAKIYNVATNKKHTVAEIIHNISSQIKDDCEVSYEGNTPGDMFGIFGDYSKINNDLGWSPKVNFQKGLNQMILNMEHISTVD